MRTWPLAAIPLLLGLASCGDSGVAGIRIDLADDLSGTITATSLLVPEGAGPLEAQSGAISWTDRANLYCVRGTFADLGDLEVAGIRFEVTPSAKFVRVILPRGNESTWPGAFTPDAMHRDDVARTFDPDGEFAGATTHFNLTIVAPANVVASNVSPKARGIAAESSGRNATLIIPVDRVTEADGSFEWHVSWE